MSVHLSKIVEVVGASPEPIGNAVGDAAKSVRDIRGFEVTQTRGHAGTGRVARRPGGGGIGFPPDAA